MMPILCSPFCLPSATSPSAQEIGRQPGFNVWRILITCHWGRGFQYLLNWEVMHMRNSLGSLVLLFWNLTFFWTSGLYAFYFWTTKGVSLKGGNVRISVVYCFSGVSKVPVRIFAGGLANLCCCIPENISQSKWLACILGEKRILSLPWMITPEGIPTKDPNQEYLLCWNLSSGVSLLLWTYCSKKPINLK